MKDIKKCQIGFITCMQTFITYMQTRNIIHQMKISNEEAKKIQCEVQYSVILS